MKTKTVITMLLFVCMNSYAQISFERHIINGNAGLAVFVRAADLDADGDLDVLVTSLCAECNGRIAWYENTDGFASFGDEQVITTSLDHPGDVAIIDIDGDDDLDLVSYSLFNSTIAWFENLDGNGNFSSLRIIPSSVQTPTSINSTDLDNDGDMDVICASAGDDKLYWYENLDGLGQFGNEQLITDQPDRPVDIFSSDLDGDNDMDLLSASHFDGVVAWYENMDGLGTFGPPQILNGSAQGASAVFAIDIDGDDDMDVLATASDDNTVAWYENLNALGGFSAEKIISSEIDGAGDVFAIDIDGDGDIDVLSTSRVNYEIAWHENLNGLGDFGSKQVITGSEVESRSVHAGDLDADGDIDVLSTSLFYERVSWFENEGELGIDDTSSVMVSLFPNPANGMIQIDSDLEIVDVKIFNESGQLIFEDQSRRGITSIDVQKLPQGIFIVQLIDVNSNYGVKKMIKK